VTEIPEHLLKRSKERRAALGLPGGEGGDDAAPPATGDAGSGEVTPAETAPVAARAATPEPAAPPPPPPPPPAYVQAATARRKIPYWAMGVIAVLPFWAIMYYNSVQVPPVNDDLLATGEEVYSACQGCHGATGAGGQGAKLNEGEVLLTYPDPKAMMEWIHLGANDWTGTLSPADYGDPDRPGGPHNTGTLNPTQMPGFDLSADELASVTRYVRETISGGPDETDIVTPELAQEAIDDAEDGQLIYKNVDPDPERVAATTNEGK
jgi:mono/diheme cytochrome c family protein